jgi:hypothetical protein
MTVPVDPRTIELLDRNHAQEVERTNAALKSVADIGRWLASNVAGASLTLEMLGNALTDLATERDKLAGSLRDARCYEEMLRAMSAAHPSPIEVEARAAVSQPLPVLCHCPDHADHAACTLVCPCNEDAARRVETGEPGPGRTAMDGTGPSRTVPDEPGPARTKVGRLVAKKGSVHTPTQPVPVEAQDGSDS